MKPYMIEYKDWSNGAWYAVSANRFLWAESNADAVTKAHAKYGSKGKAYRATEVTL